MLKWESKVISVIKGSKDRPMIILRRTNKGKLMYMLMRYNDMTEDDKDNVRAAYELVKESGQFDCSVDQNDADDIELFLSFQDNKPCG
jgi:hypothetical protein